MSAATRRGLLAALPAAGALAAASGAAAAAVPHPDAELIQRCETYIRLRIACDRTTAPDRPTVDEVFAAREAAEELEPETLDGVRAMALVAQCEAWQPDGNEYWSSSYTGDWPRWIAEAVLRLVPPFPSETA